MDTPIGEAHLLEAAVEVGSTQNRHIPSAPSIANLHIRERVVACNEREVVDAVPPLVVLEVVLRLHFHPRRRRSVQRKRCES